MAYKIKHKSQNECLIEYRADKRPRRKKRIDLSLIVFAVIALIIGIDFVVVATGYVIVSMMLSKSQARPKNFEIEMNRPKNRISVRNSDQTNPKVKTLSMKQFRGFAYEKSDSNRENEVELLFRFSPSGGIFKTKHIRHGGYSVPISNADDIIVATRDWLDLPQNSSIPERNFEEDARREPEPEPEILRDFRDVE